MLDRFMAVRSDVLPMSYQDQMADYLYFYSVITCVLTIVLIMAGTLLDRFYFPEQANHFLMIRVVASVLIGAALLVILSRFGRKHHRGMSLLWSAIPQLMICYMIVQSGGVESIYFVGLIYVFQGVAIIFPLTLLESVSLAMLTIGAYVTACLIGTTGNLDVDRFSGNLVFLTFSATIMVTITVYGDRWRRQTYKMQSEIRQQRDELIENHRALTETKLQLVHSEKMASLGTLSAGLLHELNNPINYSSIAATLTREYLAAGDIEAAKEANADAVEGIGRVKTIVGDLKAFAYQRGTDNPLESSFKLVEAIRIAGRLTAHERGDIEFAVDVDPELWVKGEKASIGSVFINLLSNAAHALRKAQKGEAGRIAIRAGAMPNSSKVMITVYDNGAGIPPGIINRIYEPFFSTSSVGEGLGLGLSISYAIIQRHQSQLMVNSLEGEYTEFSFELETDHARR